MKLLFDENLSPRLVATLASEFPESAHIEALGMRGETDAHIWDYTRDSGFVIVSKDNDFRQRVFLHGPPPKIIWLSVGNAGTVTIAGLLQRRNETPGYWYSSCRIHIPLLGLHDRGSFSH